MPIVLKCGSLNLLEPPGPVQACNEIALHFYLGSRMVLFLAALKVLLYADRLNLIKNMCCGVSTGGGTGVIEFKQV